MNDPESLSESTEETRESTRAEEIEQTIINDGRVAFQDAYDLLLSYDEEDEPRLRATGELELPSPEEGLDTYQAVMLYNFLCSQANAPQLVFKPSDKDRPQLYDWFVSSLSSCPLTEVLDHLLRKLATWKKQSRPFSEGFDEEELEGMDVRDSIDWDEFPGIRV